MKKNEPIPGVLKIGSGKKNGVGENAPGAKKKSLPEKHFKACCQVWIEVYALVVPPPPGEEVADPNIWKDNVEMRHLKLILKDLRERAEKKSVEWNEENATIRFRLFSLTAAEDDFLGNNFLLRLINSFKTKIFNNQITPRKDGRTFIARDNPVRSTPTSDSKINALKNWGLSANSCNDEINKNMRRDG